MISLDVAIARFEACRALARRLHLARDLPGGLGAACPCGVYGSAPRGSVACVDLAHLRHRALDDGWLSEAEAFLARYGAEGGNEDTRTGSRPSPAADAPDGPLAGAGGAVAGPAHDADVGDEASRDRAGPFANRE